MCIRDRSTAFDDAMVSSLLVKELKSLGSQRTQEVHGLVVQPKNRRKVRGGHIPDIHFSPQIAAPVLHRVGDQDIWMPHIIAARSYNLLGSIPAWREDGIVAIRLRYQRLPREYA